MLNKLKDFVNSGKQIIDMENEMNQNVSSDGFGYTESGLAYNPLARDSYLNAVNTEALWKREDVLRKMAEEREDYSMDRVVEAAKRNGINPVLLLDALGGNTVGNAASYTTSAAKTNSYDASPKGDQANAAKLLGSLMAAIALVVAAVA